MAGASEGMRRRAMGAYLRHLRQESGLSLDEVWVRSGVVPDTTERVEAGLKDISLVDADALGYLFRITTDALLHETDRLVELWTHGIPIDIPSPWDSDEPPRPQPRRPRARGKGGAGSSGPSPER